MCPGPAEHVQGPGPLPRACTRRAAAAPRSGARLPGPVCQGSAPCPLHDLLNTQGTVLSRIWVRSDQGSPCPTSRVGVLPATHPSPVPARQPARLRLHSQQTVVSRRGSLFQVLG